MTIPRSALRPRVISPRPGPKDNSRSRTGGEFLRCHISPPRLRDRPPEETQVQALRSRTGSHPQRATRRRGYPQAAQKIAFVSISRPFSSAWPRSIGKLSLATIPWPMSRTAAAQAASAVSMASTRMKHHVETKLIAGAPRAGHIGRTSVTSGIK
jgi:hypothetical protein